MYLIVYFTRRQIYNWRQHAQQLVRVVWNLPTTIMYSHIIIIYTVYTLFIYMTTILWLVDTRKLLHTPYSAGSDSRYIILLYMLYIGTRCVYMYRYDIIIIMYRNHPTPNTAYSIHIYAEHNIIILIILVRYIIIVKVTMVNDGSNFQPKTDHKKIMGIQ